MKMIIRFRYLMLIVFVSLFANNCLTGYYLSQEVFGESSRSIESELFFSLIAFSPSNRGINHANQTTSEAEDTDSSNEPVSIVPENNDPPENNDSPENNDLPENNDPPGPTPVVATPSFSPIAGPRTSNSLITLTTTTADATIYYTTDGTTPNTSSTQYSAPIANVWSLAGKNIRAIAVREGYENSEVVSGVYSLPPIRTGQSACWNAVGTPIACTGSGQDGDLQPGIARGYTDNGNGTVTDNATGLIWQRCSRGQSGDFCSGSLEGSNWATAVNYCDSLDLAGETWRLPSRQELETLPDNSFADPAIDSNIFPNSQSFEGFWTSTTNAQNTTRAWHVNFVYGVVNHLPKTTGDPFNARCVTGATKGYSNHFTDNEDGTIRDNTTSLVWQKCTRGQINDTICSDTATQTDWQASITYCNELNFAGRTTWRLPSINELKSIVDTNQSTIPAIDSTVFPSTDSNSTSAYWSSTTSSNLSRAINVNFRTGTVGDALKNQETSRYVRCVSSD